MIVILSIGKQIHPVEDVAFVVEVHYLLLVPRILLFPTTSAHVHFQVLPVVHLPACVREYWLSNIVEYALFLVVTVLVRVAFVQVKNV